MKKPNLNIALKLEGPESEKGLIRLDDFLRELRALQEALESIDRDMNGRSTLYYRVVNLSHRSPAKVVIEPVLKQSLKGKRLGNRWGHLPKQIHHTFFETIHQIRDCEPVKMGVSEPVLDAISNLLAGLGKDFRGGSVANNKMKFQLDEQLKERVLDLLKPQFQSVGSVEGQLLALNLARGNRFYIYPEVGPRSISCQFPESLFDKAQAYIRKNVRVYGTKFFRENTGFPFKVVDVTRVELADANKPYPEFTPGPINVIGPAADAAIRDSREEWEECE